MSRHLAALSLAAAALLTVGCGQVQDAATAAASDAASQAASKVGDAAAAEVQQQICSRVADGQVSAQDKQVLSGLVAAARSAGVPADITTPLDQVAQSGDEAPAEAVDALSQACGATPSS